MLTPKTRFVLLFIAILITIVITVLTHRHPLEKKITMQQFHGTLLNEPRSIHPFSFTGIDKKPFTEAHLKNQWTMIFFGFTHCRSMCPTAMAELAKMMRILDNQSTLKRPQVIMISIDPTHDSLDALNQYVKTFNPLFFAARGDDASVRALANELGIAYMNIANPSDPRDDDIQHTGAVMLFNPTGQLVAFFTPPHHASTLAHDYQLLLQ